jgi:hypothetical protein
MAATVSTYFLWVLHRRPIEGLNDHNAHVVLRPSQVGSNPRYVSARLAKVIFDDHAGQRFLNLKIDLYVERSTRSPEIIDEFEPASSHRVRDIDSTS